MDDELNIRKGELATLHKELIANCNGIYDSVEYANRLILAAKLNKYYADCSGCFRMHFMEHTIAKSNGDSGAQTMRYCPKCWHKMKGGNAYNGD